MFFGTHDLSKGWAALPTLIELGTKFFGDEWATEHGKDKKKDLVA